MSNKVYSNEYYDAETKERYLRQTTDSIKITAARILKRASYLENDLNKDLYDFNLSEIEKLIHLINSRTVQSVRTTVTMIRYYIRWAIAEGLRESNLNPIDSVVGEDYYDKFVDNTIPQFVHDRDIEAITHNLINAQDAAIVRCIYEGIQGTAYSEITNLKKMDVFNMEGNNLRLMDLKRDKIQTRTITISDELKMLLRKASNETTYQNRNGNASENAKYADADLVLNDYVFRPVATNVDKESQEPARSHIILRRMSSIADMFGIDLTVTLIRKSGVLYSAYNVLKEDPHWRDKNVLGKEVEKEIVARFNVKNTTLHNMKRDFLDINTIKELYIDDDKE